MPEPKRDWTNFIITHLIAQNLCRYDSEVADKHRERVQTVRNLRELCNRHPKTVSMEDVKALFRRSPSGSIHDKIRYVSYGPSYEYLTKQCEKIDQHAGPLADVVRLTLTLNRENNSQDCRTLAFNIAAPGSGSVGDPKNSTVWKNYWCYYPTLHFISAMRLRNIKTGELWEGSVGVQRSAQLLETARIFRRHIWAARDHFQVRRNIRNGSGHENRFAIRNMVIPPDKALRETGTFGCDPEVEALVSKHLEMTCSEKKKLGKMRGTS